jgi:hypothetical protein
MAAKSESPHRELQEWQHDDEHPYDPHDPTHDLDANDSGWGPNAMFSTNEALGIKSTFKGIEGYST